MDPDRGALLHGTSVIASARRVSGVLVGGAIVSTAEADGLIEKLNEHVTFRGLVLQDDGSTRVEDLQVKIVDVKRASIRVRGSAAAHVLFEGGTEPSSAHWHVQLLVDPPIPCASDDSPRFITAV